MSEWASAQEARSSMNGSSRTSTSYDMCDADRSSEGSMPPPPFRNRLRSLPFVEITDDLRQMSLNRGNGNNGHSQEDGKHVGGFRGLLRKASLSVKNRQRRHSHAVEERPQTAWHKLKSAASFQRHSKFLPPHFDAECPVDSHEELHSPIPGIGSAPPIIPLGSGGAAARATASAQNEYFARTRQFLLPEEQQGDRESGIGIALATNAEPAYLQQDPKIPRVDFVSMLPAELAIQILAHLDHHGLWNTSQVSRRWAEISQSPHIWRETFIREKSKTYAMSKPVALGAGLGLPSFKADNDWKDLYRIKENLEQNWRDGTAEPIYLNGHLDSIYCVQFDE